MEVPLFKILDRVISGPKPHVVNTAIIHKSQITPGEIVYFTEVDRGVKHEMMAQITLSPHNDSLGREVFGCRFPNFPKEGRFGHLIIECSKFDLEGENGRTQMRKADGFIEHSRWFIEARNALLNP